MATRKKAAPPPDEEGPHLLRAGMPTRLLPFDWPFLYSVLPNRDLVLNKRLPPSPRQGARGTGAGAGAGPGPDSGSGPEGPSAGSRIEKQEP